MSTIKRILSGIWKGWKAVGHFIGRCITAVLLTLFWVVCIGFYALILKVWRLGRGKRSPNWQPALKTSVSEMSDSF